MEEMTRLIVIFYKNF